MEGSAAQQARNAAWADGGAARMSRPPQPLRMLPLLLLLLLVFLLLLPLAHRLARPGVWRGWTSCATTWRARFSSRRRPSCAGALRAQPRPPTHATAAAS